jgi:hypothetical protein
MKHLLAAAVILLLLSQAAAENAKPQVSAEIRHTVRNLLSSAGALNASEFGVVPEIRVLESYKIANVVSVGAVTTVKVELKLIAIKKYDEVTHRYVERRLSKSQVEQVVIELRDVGGKTVLARPIAAYSMR